MINDYWTAIDRTAEVIADMVHDKEAQGVHRPWADVEIGGMAYSLAIVYDQLFENVYQQLSAKAVRIYAQRVAAANLYIKERA